MRVDHCSGLVIALLFALAAPLAAQTVTTDLQVSSSGFHAAIAVGTDGNIVVTWHDNVFNPNFGSEVVDIFSRTYSPAGVPLRNASRADSPNHPHVFHSRVAADATGGYTLSYALGSPPAQQVMARPLAGDGLPVGPAFRADDGPPFQTQIIGDVIAATLPSGSVLQWGRANEIRARFFDLAGTATGPSFQVATPGTPFPEHGIAPLADGAFVSIWVRVSSPHPGGLRVFEADGQPRSAVIDIDGFSPSQLKGDPSGGFAVVGRSDNEVWVERHLADGSLNGAPILVHTEAVDWLPEPDLELDTQGNLLVVWMASNAAQTTPLRARAFDTSGSPVGPTVNLTPLGVQSPTRVARLLDGGLAVAWSTTAGISAAIVTLCSGSSTCGDGTPDLLCEQCDDGPLNSDSAPGACRSNCRSAGCGDTVIDAGEECDDGNRLGEDGCDQTCRIEVCGNNRREASESCDDGNAADSDGCDSNCRVTACGNTVVSAGEECDDHNAELGDGCDRLCRLEYCGNHRRDPGEVCDDGNAVEGDNCDTNCTRSACGNGVVSPIEECDDSNLTSGDGCDSLCQSEICGNARKEVNEACDDGNLVDDDGCDTDCTISVFVDAVIDSVNRVRVTIPANRPAATKRIKLPVRLVRADAPRSIRVVAADGSCPAGTLTSLPDFERTTPGAQDSATFAVGDRKLVSLSLALTRADFTFIDPNTPQRCVLQVGLDSLDGHDPHGANNALPIVIEVYDRAVPAGGPELYVEPVKPQKLTIRQGFFSKSKDVRVRVRNGVGATLTADDGDCPDETFSVKTQPSDSGVGEVQVRANRTFFESAEGSPARCTAQLTVSAGGGDADPGNNTVPVVINVIDEND